MHTISPLIQDLTIMLGIASIVTLLFQRIHQPVILGYLFAGMIIGPYTPPHILISSVEEVKVLSELGVIFLMFFLGLDFSFHKLTRVGFSASITGIIEVLLMITIGYLTGWVLGWPFHERLFLGAALAISSTTIIIKALEELNLKSKRFAEYIFGILVVEDLLAILLLVALSTIVTTKSVLSMNMLTALFQLLFIVGGWFLIGYFLVPTFLRRISRFVNEETLTIVSIALCLLLVTIAAYFHYSTALGAFIMGSILAETPLVYRIESVIRPIKDIFAAVFFISVGMLIDPSVIIHHFPTIMLITSIYVIGKITSTTFGAFLTGQSVSTSMRIGFSVAQIGEFSFIIASLGLALHVTGNNLYPIIVAVSAITTFTTPYSMKLSGYLANKFETNMPQRFKEFLNGYSAWVYRTLSTSHTKLAYRKAMIRVILNGIIVAIIFSLAQHLILPEINLLIKAKSISRVITWSIAILVSSPFIWGMLFSARPSHFKGARKEIIYQAGPVIACWFITAIEITVLSITYFHTIFTTSLLLLATFIYAVLSYRQLEKSYHWFERILMNNIKTKDETQQRYAQLAPWETHFVEIIVDDQSTLVGKSLTESRLRQLYGVNIVAIYRGSNVLVAPRGDQLILSHDKLVVLGNDEQIDAFQDVATQATLKEPELPNETLDNFTLRGIVLTEDSPFINKSIRESHIRELANGIIVGIEHRGTRLLNPDPAMALQSGDLILIVGETDHLKEIFK